MDRPPRPAMHRLELEWNSTMVGLRTPPVRVEFLDFVIDEQPLRDWVRWLEGDHALAQIGDRPSRFTRGFPADVRARAYRELVLDAEAPVAGRVPLYVCPCGDLACGCVTVLVERDGSAIRWSALGWGESACFPSIPVFTFDRDAYRTALLAGRL